VTVVPVAFAEVGVTTVVEAFAVVPLKADVVISSVVVRFRSTVDGTTEWFWVVSVGSWVVVEVSFSARAANEYSVQNNENVVIEGATFPFCGQAFSGKTTVSVRERTIRARTDTIRYLRNDLYCVEWGVKLYSLTHYEYSSVHNGRYRYRYEYSLCHGVPATYIIRTRRSLRERSIYAMGGTLHPRLNNADH